jgi:hypothetical protein
MSQNRPAMTRPGIGGGRVAGGSWRGGRHHGHHGRHHRHHRQYGYPSFGYGFGYGAYAAPYGYYDNSYTYEEPVYEERLTADDEYCSRRFRSYDPASGTYLGYDGERHPCP